MRVPGWHRAALHARRAAPHHSRLRHAGRLVAHLLPQHSHVRAAQGESHASRDAEEVLKEPARSRTHPRNHRRKPGGRGGDARDGKRPAKNCTEECLSRKTAADEHGGTGHLCIMKGVKKQHLPEKVCVTCGRPFAWRKKWVRVWDQVKFCSDRCRMNKPAQRPTTR